MCNLKKSYYESDDPFHQFFVQESQGNQEILKIFPETSFVSLNGKADYSLSTAICKIQEIKEFPSERKLPGFSDIEETFIRLKIGPELNPSSGLLLKKEEQNGSTSLRLAEDQLSFQVVDKTGLVVKKEKAKNPQKHLNRIYLEIEFQPKKEEKSFRCTIVIHILSKSKDKHPLYRGIIDFGSDALQMRIINPHGKKDDVDILSKIAENFYGYKEDELRQQDKNKLFYQELPDETLFKSDIFIRNKNGKSTCNDPPGVYPKWSGPQNSQENRFEDTEELVNVLTSTQIEDLWMKHRFLAPNLKLAALKDFFNKRIQFEHEDDNPDPMGSKDVTFSQLNHVIYRIALNKFLHTLFLVIRKATRERISPYVHLTLLVPNVYQQSLIHELIKGLLKDWSKALYKHYQFAGLEIQIMSESDATFLGMLNELEPAYQDQFLIIDGGKGTTDISIIRVDKENEEGDIKSYSSIYRGGFIGAGNLISYAFIETLLAIFYSEDPNKRREFMETYLISHSPKANLNEILDFLGLVEQLKVSFHDPAVEHLRTDQIREHIKSAYLKNKPQERISHETLDSSEINLWEYVDKNESNTPLGTLNKWIINTFKIDHSDHNSYQKSFTLSDDFHFIKNQVESMAETFYQNLSALKINGKKLRFKKILFAGRSFLFKSLLDQMKAKLEEFLLSEPETSGDNFMSMANNPKKVCLHGALGQQEVNHLSSLIGIPFVSQKQATTRKADPHKPSETDGLSGYVNHSIGDSTDKELDSTSQGKWKKHLKNVTQKLNPIWTWFKKNLLLSLHKSQLNAWNNRNISEVDVNFFLSGSKIIPKGSKVFINGNRINQEKWMQGHNFKLFYGGEDFYCRILDEEGQVKETRKIEFQLEDTSQKDDLLIKSVFPFIELGGSSLPVSTIDPFLEQEEVRDLEKEAQLANKYLQTDPELPDIGNFFSPNGNLTPDKAYTNGYPEMNEAVGSFPNGNGLTQNSFSLVHIDQLNPEVEQRLQSPEKGNNSTTDLADKKLETPFEEEGLDKGGSKNKRLAKRGDQNEGQESGTDSSSNILGV